MRREDDAGERPQGRRPPVDGPSGVAAQSRARQRARISPGPSKRPVDERPSDCPRRSPRRRRSMGVTAARSSPACGARVIAAPVRCTVAAPPREREGSEGEEATHGPLPWGGTAARAEGRSRAANGKAGSRPLNGGGMRRRPTRQSRRSSSERCVRTHTHPLAPRRNTDETRSTAGTARRGMCLRDAPPNHHRGLAVDPHVQVVRLHDGVRQRPPTAPSRGSGPSSRRCRRDRRSPSHRPCTARSRPRRSRPSPGPTPRPRVELAARRVTHRPLGEPGCRGPGHARRPSRGGAIGRQRSVIAGP
jgi:hypothetical protein